VRLGRKRRQSPDAGPQFSPGAEDFAEGGEGEVAKVRRKIAGEF